MKTPMGDEPGGVQRLRPGTWREPPVKSPRTSTNERPKLLRSVWGAAIVFRLNCKEVHRKEDGASEEIRLLTAETHAC